jgi:hypothetical protein
MKEFSKVAKGTSSHCFNCDRSLNESVKIDTGHARGKFMKYCPHCAMYYTFYDEVTLQIAKIRDVHGVGYLIGCRKYERAKDIIHRGSRF